MRLQRLLRQINLFDKDRQEASAAPAVPTFGMTPVAAAPEPQPVKFDLETSPAPMGYVPPVVSAPSAPAPDPVLYQQAAPQAATPATVQHSLSRPTLDARAEERRRRLQELSNGLTNDAIKDQLETPAYLRRQVKLENVVPSSEQNISRFNLSDDNELLGDNRFLHDNVD
jgi:cell division protein FtsZ